MPIVKACAWPGCRRLAQLGNKYCDPCLVIARKTIEQRKSAAPRAREERKSAHARGYTRKWTAAARSFRRAHPTCNICSTDDRPVPSAVVDHIIPHKGNMALFWQSANWQAICKACHDEKTWREFHNESVPNEFGKPI